MACFAGMNIYIVQKAEKRFKLQDKKIGLTTDFFIVAGLFLFPLLPELILFGDLPLFK
ncbi:hypothetical protein NCCP133_21640 [Cytobacillus sp. NCCP-133]|nr:hypothetical protein NCCP133_21640 [Cytobacillus sp. NCCP-133]